MARERFCTFTTSQKDLPIVSSCILLLISFNLLLLAIVDSGDCITACECWTEGGGTMYQLSSSQPHCSTGTCTLICALPENIHTSKGYFGHSERKAGKPNILKESVMLQYHGISRQIRKEVVPIKETFCGEVTFYVCKQDILRAMK